MAAKSETGNAKLEMNSCSKPVTTSNFLYFLSCEEVRQLPRRTQKLHAEGGLVPDSATTLSPLFQTSARSVLFLYTQFF